MSRIDLENKDDKNKTGILVEGTSLFPNKPGRKPRKDKDRGIVESAFCEHNIYRSTCGRHPKIFMRGLDESDYQQFLNFRDRLGVKYGYSRRVSWATFLHLLSLEVKELFPNV